MVLLRRRINSNFGIHRFLRWSSVLFYRGLTYHLRLQYRGASQAANWHGAETKLVPPKCWALSECYGFSAQKTTVRKFENGVLTWRMPSSGILRSVILVRTDVSEERTASIIRVTRTIDRMAFVSVSHGSLLSAAYKFSGHDPGTLGDAVP
jgi:hypothetical protein